MPDKTSTLLPMSILGLLFFIFGFVTWLNGSLIPFLKIICDLTAFEALLVTFAFYIAYTVMALPMAIVLRYTGYKQGMALGLGIMAAGALLFIPAAQSADYRLFLGGLFTLGAGLTLLQTASNPYIVHIGPHESAAARISIMGLINKGAGVLAPLLFTALIFADLTAPVSADATPEVKAALAQKLVSPYLSMASALALLAVFVRLAPLPKLPFEAVPAAPGDSVWRHPHLLLGAVTLFFYVGIEVIAGDTIGLYGQSLGIENATALTAYTMVFMVLGYLIGVTTIPRFISQEKALRYTALAGLVFTAGILWSSEQSHTVASILWGWSGIGTLPDSLTFVALLGLANALVWPAVWPLALRDLGPLTAKGSALLIMGIAGGALLPLLFGQIGEMGGTLRHGYALGFVCYAFIFYYALTGHSIRRTHA
ncbi:sugar MFS transporter [Sulfurimonas sp. ST-25]|uniref:sugar MFS transporter n=1 Tax=Sulfurimonas sp. ST-25 TaxID=3400151 RepID=UPI003A89FBAA